MRKKVQIAAKYPYAVCSLDLEANANFKQPALSTLWFVGTQEFKYDGTRYRGLIHKVWHQQDLMELELYLRKFNVIILGHNILKFDYGVLSDKICLKGIIEKTVDTLSTMWWRVLSDPHDISPDMRRYLSWQVGRELKGLGLDPLSRANGGKGKSLDPKKLRDMWRRDPARVYDYNAQDCAMSFQLWRRMVRLRKINIPNKGAITFGDNHVSQLLGYAPWISFDDWDFWRKVEWRSDANSADFIPIKRCPNCGRWDQLSKFDETAGNWSDGQLFEWYAGMWGTADCLNCGLLIDWEDDKVSFKMPRKTGPGFN